MYAILSHGGRQYRVSAGDRLVVDRLEAEVGSVVALAPVLLTGGDGTTALGADLDGMRVAVTVVAHRRGEKLRIFKYKAKKRSRKVAGYRSDLTELRVESILAKGAALPRPSASTARASEAHASRRGAATPAAAKPEAETKGAKRTAGAIKRAAPSTAKRASSPAAKPKAADGAAKADTKAAATPKKPAPKPKAATPKKPAPKPKAAPKRATKDGSAAADKEKRDGA